MVVRRKWSGTVSAKTHDYDILKREFLADPDLSIRELCRRHDIKGYSAVAQFARENGWYDQKEQIKARRDDKVIERVSDTLANELASRIESLSEDWLTVTQAAVYKYAEQLRNPDFKVHVDDLVKLMDKGLVLTGNPSTRTEERHLALTGSLEGLPPEFVRRLAEATRPRLTDGAGTDRAAQARDEKSRQN
jgi:hypothetical protein